MIFKKYINNFLKLKTLKKKKYKLINLKYSNFKFF